MDEGAYHVRDRKLEVARIVFLAFSIFVVFFWPKQSLLLAILAVLVGGFPVFREAIDAARDGRIHMESAMALGMLASVAIGELLAAVVIAFFTLIAEMMDSLTYEKGRGAIAELVKLYPRSAIRKTKTGEEEEIRLGDIRPGDLIIVKPGQRMPIDGVIESGEASIDESPVTGESLPVEKALGDDVFAGTINTLGAVEVRVGKVGRDTTLGKIIGLVEEAEASKAPVQRFADRFASKFVPTILGIAFLVFLFTGNPRAAIAVIVVACPCAISMATPLAVVASVGRAARKGIIIKGGTYLEELSKVDAVVLDKTGTLTMGELAVTDFIGFGEYSNEDALSTAAMVEKHSEHPFGRAIMRKALELNLEIPEHVSCTIIAGRGIVCQMEGGAQVIMGNRKLMAEKRIAITRGVESYLREQEAAGKTPALLAGQGIVWGVVSVADRVRDDAAKAVKELRDLGMRKIMILTGDNPRTAADIAKQVGIPENDVSAEMMPEQKVSKVKELMDADYRVMMVGDGINDAPALAQADIGVAMGAAGVDAALEAADVALMTNDFRNLPEAVKIGRRAFAIITQNITVSILFNVVGITLAAVGILSPLMAAVAHVVPDFFLFLNSSRLLHD